MQSDFGLPEPDSPWRPTASNDEAVLKAMSSAHHEYVTELLRRIRDLP